MNHENGVSLIQGNTNNFQNNYLGPSISICK